MSGVFIPIGKAIAPVEIEELTCEGCLFENCQCLDFLCHSRPDDKNVIFKMVDMPVQEKI
jgi:hypothetical protein